MPTSTALHRPVKYRKAVGSLIFTNSSLSFNSDDGLLGEEWHYEDIEEAMAIIQASNNLLLLTLAENDQVLFTFPSSDKLEMAETDLKSRIKQDSTDDITEEEDEAWMIEEGNPSPVVPKKLVSDLQGEEGYDCALEDFSAEARGQSHNYSTINLRAKVQSHLTSAKVRAKIQQIRGNSVDENYSQISANIGSLSSGASQKNSKARNNETKKQKSVQESIRDDPEDNSKMTVLNHPADITPATMMEHFKVVAGEKAIEITEKDDKYCHFWGMHVPKRQLRAAAWVTSCLCLALAIHLIVVAVRAGQDDNGGRIVDDDFYRDNDDDFY